MRALDHPNIVKLLDFFEEETNFYVVLEYLPGGELFDRIVKKTFYSEREARDTVRLIALAIKYCHDKEILRNEPYGKAVDMWSIGVITYILLGGYPPFHDDNQKALFRKIKMGDFEFHEEYWGGVSQEAKDLISSLLNIDPNARLTVDDMLKHPWIHRDGAELATNDLMDNLAELRKYQATRKFKAAANAVIAINRMNNMFGSGAKQDEKQPPSRSEL
ncbi:cmk-1 [Symbiodinium microadriaticum]|nr:cmk-1 [Symbiodinium microadriaticum]